MSEPRALPADWTPADQPDWESWDWVEVVVPPAFWGLLAGIATALSCWEICCAR